MPNQLTLEICVESVDHAIAAERGGADRVELCSDLPSGGITPSAPLMRAARQLVNIPVHVLIRPRAGDFLYSDQELATMRREIDAAKQFGMNGIVLGILSGDHRVDITRTKALVEAAHPLPVTFHRAFDATPNMEESLDAVLQTGASRVLTSGGELSAEQGLPALARLVQAAKGRISVMACGAIDSENVLRIARETLAPEYHTSVGTSQPRTPEDSAPSSYGNHSSSPRLPSSAFEERVRNLVNVLRSLSDPSVLKVQPASAEPPRSKEPTA
jgi:copper homeostasis protein